MFSRGDGPLVSVLFPTRGRPEGLKKAVLSLMQNAHNPAGIEFLFKLDDDDPASMEAVREVHKEVGSNFHVEVSDRGNGYHDMHHWINRLASQAKGDWLIIFNDDAEMLTPNWDAQLEYSAMPEWHGVEDVCSFVVPSQDGGWGFFFLRRKVVEILGRFSYIPHNDTWVTTLMKMVDSLFFLTGISIRHKAAEPAKENEVVKKDDTWEEGNEARLSTKYTTHHPDQARVKLLDAMRLQFHIDAHRKDIPNASAS